MLANIPFQKDASFFFEFFLHISVGLSGPLPTAFELKKVHATALTDNAINLLKRPKTSKYIFEIFPTFQNFKNGKSGGFILH